MKAQFVFSPYVVMLEIVSLVNMRPICLFKDKYTDIISTFARHMSFCVLLNQMFIYQRALPKIGFISLSFLFMSSAEESYNISNTAALILPSHGESVA